MSQYRLFSWGTNAHGQLGQGNIQDEELLVPREVDLSPIDLQPENIIKITGGAAHTLILDNKGRVFSCGWNDKGQAGTSTASAQFQQLKILEGKQIVDIACGWESSMALTENGQIFTWGSNSHGQLGLKRANVADKIKEPSRVELNAPVQRISMGLWHSAVVTRDARVFTCGVATKGQLGVDLRGAKYSREFVEVPQITNVRDVACGQHHTLVVTSDNEILTWGDNKHGQLSVDPAIQLSSSLVPIAVNNHKGVTSINKLYCGWTHSAILTDDEKVFCWGRNSYGQLGRGKLIQSVETWKMDSPIIPTSIQQLSVGSEHNIALLEDRSIVSWGWNEHGNCGNGGTEDIFMPTKIALPEVEGVLIGTGAGHSFAVVKTK